MYVQSCQKVWFTLLIGLYLLVPQGGANPLDRLVSSYAYEYGPLILIQFCI